MLTALTSGVCSIDSAIISCRDPPHAAAPAAAPAARLGAIDVPIDVPSCKDLVPAHPAGGIDAIPGHPPPACALLSTLAAASTLASLVLLVQIRRRVRAEYSIPDGCCGGCADCCAALWCAPLATAQVMRHLGVEEYTRYSCASADGRGPAAVWV